MSAIRRAALSFSVIISSTADHLRVLERPAAVVADEYRSSSLGTIERLITLSPKPGDSAGVRALRVARARASTITNGCAAEGPSTAVARPDSACLLYGTDHLISAQSVRSPACKRGEIYHGEKRRRIRSYLAARRRRTPGDYRCGCAGWCRFDRHHRTGPAGRPRRRVFRYRRPSEMRPQSAGWTRHLPR